MSHPVNDELTFTIRMGIDALRSDMNWLRDYFNADHERLELITPREIKLFNTVHQALKEYDRGNQANEDNTANMRAIRPENQ